MRKIVLVGNGYDLAAGLDTSYSNFILHVYRKYLITAFSKDVDNELITIHRVDPRNGKVRISELNKLISMDELRNYLSKPDINRIFSSLTPKGLFASILNRIWIDKWVDIEHLYFEKLVEAHRKDVLRKDPDGSSNFRKVIELNKQLELLKSELVQFLLEQMKAFDKKKAIDTLKPLHKQIEPEPRPSGVVAGVVLTATEPPVEYISFNYTPVLSSVLFELRKEINANFMAIHGSIGLEEYPVIFGYGDDTNEEFKEFEGVQENYSLENLKTSHYTLTGQYQKLLEKLEAGQFEVCIVGHSCGISDKTLLQTIFEHPNCAQILVYHYKGIKEFSEKSMAIARNFRDKTLHRARVKYDPSLVIPQATKDESTEDQGVEQ
tara:strand:- start:3276 stop:4409 length:1134 start_codon:yes stop_codon:yes gene_type:complete